MDNLIQLAMQIIFCLLIAAILGAIIGYLLGKMSKCDKDDYDLDPSNDRKNLNDYENDDTLNDYSTQENDIKETLSAGIDKTKGMAAAGIAGVGAVGAGLYEGTKDIGSNIGDTLGEGYDKTKSMATEATDSIKDHALDVKEYVVDDSSKISREIQEDYTDHVSVGQEVGIRPASIAAPSNGEVDDLKEVSGIGLKIEDVLNSLGIYYFEQISQWSPENIEWIENYLSVKRRVKKEDWIGQAKLLSAGGHTEFSKKVKRGENQNYK